MSRKMLGEVPRLSYCVKDPDGCQGERNLAAMGCLRAVLRLDRVRRPTLMGGAGLWLMSLRATVDPCLKNVANTGSKVVSLSDRRVCPILRNLLGSKVWRLRE